MSWKYILMCALEYEEMLPWMKEWSHIVKGGKKIAPENHLKQENKNCQRFFFVDCLFHQILWIWNIDWVQFLPECMHIETWDGVVMHTPYMKYIQFRVHIFNEIFSSWYNRYYTLCLMVCECFIFMGIEILRFDDDDVFFETTSELMEFYA